MLGVTGLQLATLVTLPNAIAWIPLTLMALGVLLMPVGQQVGQARTAALAVGATLHLVGAAIVGAMAAETGGSAAASTNGGWGGGCSSRSGPDASMGLLMGIGLLRRGRRTRPHPAR